MARPPPNSDPASGADASGEPSGKVARTETAAKRAAPKIVEDLTILDPEPLPQRVRSRVPRVTLSPLRIPSVSTEERGTEDPGDVGRIRDA